MKAFVNSLLLGIVLCTCSSKKAITDRSFGIGISQGVLDNDEIDEASGLAASVVNKDMLWTHNDSGDKARIFLIDNHAHFKASYLLKGIDNRDWEDIAVGPGPENKQTYVYIGDIGDNFAHHDYKYIYRIKEPSFREGDKQEQTVDQVDSIRFILSDGNRDTESLMVDPHTKAIYIISKRESKEVHVYKLPFPQSTTALDTAKLIAKIPYRFIVSGDISVDGDEVLLKSIANVYYWKRKPDEPLQDMFKRPGKSLPYATEPQGEAVAFDRSGRGYYTISESVNRKTPHLMFYKRIAGPPLDK